MPLLDLAGVGLSLLALVAFAFLVRDWWRRRGRFRSLELRTLRISGRTMGAVWLFVLVLSLVASVYDPLVLKVEASTRAAAPAMGDPFAEPPDPRVAVQQTSTIEAPLPFYRWSRTDVHMGGRLQLTTTTRTLQIPLWFLVGILLYVRFVMRGRVTAHEETAVA